MYPPDLVAPMKSELTQVGFDQLVTPEQVDEALSPESGTVLVMINSVCGCAAGSARPGVRMAIAHDKVPSKLTTVFAGVDQEATAHARKYMLPFPPSSPSIGLFNNGQLVHFLERHHIESSPAEMIAENLKAAFKEFC